MTSPTSVEDTTERLRRMYPGLEVTCSALRVTWYDGPTMATVTAAFGSIPVYDEEGPIAFIGVPCGGVAVLTRKVRPQTVAVTAALITDDTGQQPLAPTVPALLAEALRAVVALGGWDFVDAMTATAR